MNLKEAIEFLGKSLKEDPELYYTWQSNIAMSIYDGFYSSLPTDIISVECYKNRKLFHEKCNNAAKRFLDLLTYLAQKGEIKNET